MKPNTTVGRMNLDANSIPQFYAIYLIFFTKCVFTFKIELLIYLSEFSEHLLLDSMRHWIVWSKKLTN